MKNALFGRYWPSNSPIHKLDPRTKLLAMLVLIILLFSALNFFSLAVIAAFLCIAFAIARIPPGQALRSVLPLVFIIVLTMLFNIAFVTDGRTLAEIGVLRITEDGLFNAAYVGLRLLLLLLLGSLLTMTTTTADITDATEKILSPLERLHVPVHDFAFVMGTALRFVPQLADEFSDIRSAQTARGARLATSPIKGVRSITSVIIPMFVGVFRRADTLAAAMESRCYVQGAPRTRLRPMRFGRADAITSIVSIVLTAIVVALNIAA